MGTDQRTNVNVSACCSLLCVTAGLFGLTFLEVEVLISMEATPTGRPRRASSVSVPATTEEGKDFERRLADIYKKLNEVELFSGDHLPRGLKDLIDKVSAPCLHETANIVSKEHI
jgi:hypothetical protein